MFRFEFLFLLIYLFAGELLAQSGMLPIIPDSINNNSNAVIINEKTDIKLINQSEMIEHHTAKILIKNKQGDYLSYIILFYDPFTKIEQVKLHFYDSNGKLLEKIPKKKFNDVAASGQNTLYSDSRALVYRYTPVSYPYIMELDYTINSSNTAFIPDWQPYPDYNTGILSTEYHFWYPAGFKVYSIEKNLEEYQIIDFKNGERISYTGDYLPPLEYEDLSPPLSEIAPQVRLAVNKFELAGVPGRADSWEDFGNWMNNKLLKGRDQLKPETVQKIKNMVAGISDPVERAKIIYDYVQKKVHYINVAIGIGGWQPMPADEVDKLGYGDCKALTYYTKTLLEIADVPSIYTVVYAGNSQKNIDEKLIGVQGNHVFLCIPQAQDSIWLECTSQKMPFGFTDNFTNNRKALAIKDKGSKIIRTKQMNDEENLQNIKAQYSVTSTGDIKARLQIKAYGNEYTQHLFHYDGLNPNELENEFAGLFNYLQNIQFRQIEVNNNKSRKRYEENLEFTALHYAEKTSDTTLIFMPNAFNRINYVPAKIKNRKYPFIIKTGFKYDDEYNIKLPKGFKVNRLPENQIIKNEFGIYRLEYTRTNDEEFIYHRIFLLHSGKYPPDSYKKYRKFRKKIKKLEKQKILISKK